MERPLSFLHRFSCAGLVGAQLFFSAVAAQQVFPPEVAALPHGAPRRELAAELVGAMLARLDAATMIFCAIAVVAALLLGRRLAAVLPLLAGLCAVASIAYFTPAILAMRLTNTTSTPRFGLMHGLSASLLLVEMVLLTVAAWRSPGSTLAAEPEPG